MEIKPLKTTEDYQAALERLDILFDSPAGYPESDEADILAVLVEDYERAHYPIDAPDPVEAIKIRMEQLNLKQNDLVEAFGSKSRVSEVLNRKRKLTIDMIRKLSVKLNLPVSVLVKDYNLMG
ncbi:MAG: helix-turn-helix domain-containing protein [Clostridia bacterium]|nr:helix-turn-helix domain-containing protein [Clostridia bacterium]